MTTYWFLFLYPSIVTLLPFKGDKSVQTLAFMSFGIIVVIILGFRWETGGDWTAYIGYLEAVRGISLSQAIILDDPGFLFISWVSVSLGWELYGVNTMAATVFMWGLISFCKKQPMPWVGLMAATPYLLIVVGMGYTRQSMALGIVFFALSVWDKKDFKIFVGIILFACLFHKSASLILPFSLFINKRYLLIKWLTIIPIASVSVLWIFLSALYQEKIRAYTGGDQHSSGALVRVLMITLPSVILLLFNDRFNKFKDNNLWQTMALLSFFSLALVFFYSTLIDRIALYLAPIQIAVFSRLPVLVEDHFRRTLTVCFIIAFYAVVLFTWLNFADNSYAWVPYKSIFEACNDCPYKFLEGATGHIQE